MGKQHKPRDKRFRPLSKSEIEQYDEAARDSNDRLTELTARTLLHTGPQTGEFAHLRGNWLDSVDGGDYGVLRVPREEECIGGAGAVDRSSSENTNSHDRGAACYACRTTRGGHWEPRAQTAVRKIPIEEEGVYELLADWFETHEQIPLLHGAIATRVQQIAERAGLSRQVQPRDLRDTYGTILARKGVEPNTFAAVMGFRLPEPPSVRPCREIVREFEKTWEAGEESEPDTVTIDKTP